MNKVLGLVFCFIALNFFGQNKTDSLNFAFYSDFEAKKFNKIASNDSDYNFIDALLSIDSLYNADKASIIHLELNNFFNKTKTKVSSYNDKKKVKYVFNKVHERFFKKYELDSNFSDIFKDATYNCVTGTALYAHIFDFLEIPYQIKETPTHVFLVAYPRTLNILVETTVPGKLGSYAPSETLMKKAVDELVEMKLITSVDVNRLGYNRAFNEYFYGDGSIAKEELIGIQYFNRGISYLNKELYELAYNNFLKSQQVYTNKKAAIVTETTLHFLIDKLDFSRIDNFNWFVKYADSYEDVDYLEYKLSKILTNNKWLDDDYTTIEKKLGLINNKECQNKLLEVYYVVLADRAHKFQRVSEALYYSNKIHKLNPDNLDAKNYIATFEIDRLAQKNVSAEREFDLDSLLKKYPFLKEFGIYNRYRTYLYSFLVAKSFNDNNKLKGQEYLFQLERLIENKEESTMDFNQEAIGNAYGSIGAYYYRKGQKKKAIEVMKGGLEYSPENANILKKIQLIKNSY